MHQIPVLSNNGNLDFKALKLDLKKKKKKSLVANGQISIELGQRQFKEGEVCVKGLD